MIILEQVDRTIGDRLARSFIFVAMTEHPAPWRLEEGKYYRVLDADGEFVMEQLDLELAEYLIECVQGIYDEDKIRHIIHLIRDVEHKDKPKIPWKPMGDDASLTEVYQRAVDLLREHGVPHPTKYLARHNVPLMTPT